MTKRKERKKCEFHIQRGYIFDDPTDFRIDRIHLERGNEFRETDRDDENEGRK